MGPVFYLVQSNGALRPISALPLKNWPRLFGSARLGQKKPLRSPPKKIRLRRAKKCHALPGMPVGLLPGRQLEARWKRERRDANGFGNQVSTVFAGKLSQQSVVCCSARLRRT